MVACIPSALRARSAARRCGRTGTSPGRCAIRRTARRRTRWAGRWTAGAGSIRSAARRPSRWAAWNRRPPLRQALRRQWLEIGAGLAAALLLYQALLAYVFAARFFTLAGWPSDNIEFYAPAGQYLRNHAFNANQPLAIVDNPT